MVFLVKNCKPQGAIKLRNPLIQPTIHLSIQPCERRVKLMLFSRLQGRQSCSRSSMHDATSRCSKIDLMPPCQRFSRTCAKMISREAGNKRGIPWQRVESSAPLKKLSQEHGQHNDHFSSAREYMERYKEPKNPGTFQNEPIPTPWPRPSNRNATPFCFGPVYGGITHAARPRPKASPSHNQRVLPHEYSNQFVVDLDDLYICTTTLSLRVGPVSNMCFEVIVLWSVDRNTQVRFSRHALYCHVEITSAEIFF